MRRLVDNRSIARIAATAKTLVDRYGWILILGGTWIFLLAHLDFGWIPNDDGTLAHAAARVRLGEIPHLNFDEPYPGLLSFVNAAALSLLGDDLLSLRYPFIVIIGGWMLLSYFLAGRVLSPALSALSVSVMGASVFMHMSPMPTWYILFLGTGALYCTVRYDESGRPGFLIVGGLAIGIGTLIKTSALLMAMAVGLALAIRAIRSGDTAGIRWGRILMVLAVAATGAFIASAPTTERIMLLIVPMIILVAAEWRPAYSVMNRPSSRHLLGEVGLVALGVALPVAAYTFVYWRLGALAELGRALLITPGLYVEEFDQNVPDIRYAFATILPLVIGWLLLKLEDRPRRLIVIGLLVLLPVSYYFNPTAVILAMFVTLMWLGLFVGVAVLRKSDRSVTMHFAAVALVSGAMCFQLIRFPASNLYYMMHAVPLLVLAAMVLAGSYQPRSTRLLVVGFIAVLGTLVVAKLDGRLFAGQAPFERDPYVAMQVPRGNLRIPSSTAYIDDLALSIDDHVKEGDFVLAGPDSPEVYYLAQVRNETPVFFDFLSQARDETLSTAKYLGSLSPDVFVNNREPARSRPVQESEIPSSCARAGSFGPRDVFVACG